MLRKFVLFLGLFCLCGSSIWAMGDSPDGMSSNPMFQHFVSIGDSLTHGVQSAAVDETRQPYAFPARIAEQMGVQFDLPLLKFPGYLVNIEDVLKGNIAWWQYYYPLIGGVRVDDYADQEEIDNFGVSGAAIKDGLGTDGSAGGYYKLVLGPDGSSMVEQALSHDPTFVSFWLANNDILGAALNCDVSALTPIEQFRTDFTACVSRIAQAEEENGGSVLGVVIANVPDVTAIAYLSEVDDPDFPAGTLRPFWMLEPSSNMVLTPEDVAQVQERTQEVNQEIYEAAIANNWAFVDAYAIFEQLKTYGRELIDGSGQPSGQVVTTDYLGGFFSLDGVHPSVTGHAVCANYMIEAINDFYGTSLGYVDEVATAQNDSLLQEPVDPRDYLDGWVADAIHFVVDMFL